MPKIPTNVFYLKHLPLIKDLQPTKSESDFLFIVDRRVVRTNPKVKRWLQPRPFVYEVEAGETLKDLEKLAMHLTRIFKLLGPNAHRNLTIVALGGGSVGDFAGFVASVFKRGVDLIQIPSSWLAAIDSAHGGKNGLNLKGLKNQIGTFYHPKQVLVVQDVLSSQSREQFDDALGELYKMALLTTKPWGLELIDSKIMSQKMLWKYLPLAVAEKYHIVENDPFERQGLRHFLNLGHTFGHVMELSQGHSHGRSVAIGLRFALAFSYELGVLSKREWTSLHLSPLFRWLDSLTFSPLSEKKFREILEQDKKKVSATALQFVLLKKPGKPILKQIEIADLIAAGRKYGFITTTRRR